MGNANFISKYRSSNSSNNKSINSCNQTNNLPNENGGNISINGNMIGNNILSADSNNNGACSTNFLSLQQQINTTNSSNGSKTKKVTIPFDRWIKFESKKWGHFKDFDFYNLNGSLSSHNSNHSNNNIIITINNSNVNSSNHHHTLTLTSFSTNQQQQHSSNSTSLNNESLSNSYFLSTNVNNYLNNSNSNSSSNNNYTILPSFLSNDNKNSFMNNYNNFINTNSNLSPLHYINGHFFKPIERLGDSQFILSQWPYNDVIVTVPCNIGRYRQNDKQVKEIVHRLNRVIGVCEQFIVFQIWKGNNEVEIFIYEYNVSSTTTTTQPQTNNANNNQTLSDNLVQKNDNTDATNNAANTTNPTSNSIDTNMTTSTTTTPTPIMRPPLTSTSGSSSSNRIVRKLNRRFNSRTYACLISPDRNFLLITPDYEFNYSSHHTHSHAECTIIININTFQLLRVIPARCDQRFAFDPRYGMPNYQAPRFAEFDTVRGQIFDLSLEKVVVCSNHTLKTKVFRVEYTKDGYLIIVICTLPVFHRRARRNYFIYILNSSTLLHMRSIIDYRGPLLTTYMFSNDFNLLFNMYPSLSNCASSIAVLKNIEPSLNTRVIELYSLPNVCSMSLKELCRRVILRHVDSKHLNRLPLPPKLISYLSFNNIYVNNKNQNSHTTNAMNTNNVYNNNNGSNNSNRRNMIIHNFRRNISNRLNHNKRAFSNFLLQIKNSNR